MSSRSAASWLTPFRATASAVVILIAGVLVTVYQDGVFQAQQAREVRVQSAILAAGITAALDFGDARVVQEHIDAMRINPELETVAVYDVRGRVVGSFRREGEESPPASAPAMGTVIEGGHTTVTVPVVEGNRRLGSVHIRASRQPLDRRLTRHAAIMLLAVMAALLIAAMGSSQRKLTAANRELEGQTIALGETNALLRKEMEERSKAEEALRQSQKMEAVGQLSGGVAHDFNNLLTIIQGNLHLLTRKSGGEPEEIRGYIDAANEAVDRAGHLVRRLLAFARRQPLSPRRVDPNQLVNGMRDLILHSVGAGIATEWNLTSHWNIVCDVNQMENVILNLAINARDAMSGGGTLTIETRDTTVDDSQSALRGDHVEIRIRDTGCGMTPEVLKRAFDPFFTTKPQGEGTGLGLSMAFAFIRQSNGEVRIDSAPGAGTSVIILLPRDPGEAVAG